MQADAFTARVVDGGRGVLGAGHPRSGDERPHRHGAGGRPVALDGGQRGCGATRMSRTPRAGCTAVRVAFPLCKVCPPRPVFQHGESTPSPRAAGEKRNRRGRTDARISVRKHPPRSASANRFHSSHLGLRGRTSHLAPRTVPRAWHPARFMDGHEHVRHRAPLARRPRSHSSCSRRRRAVPTRSAIPSLTNCRTQLLTLIQNESVGIDVGFWFMQDSRYMNEIIQPLAGRRAGAHHHGHPRQRRLPRQRRHDPRLQERRHPAAPAAPPAASTTGRR